MTDDYDGTDDYGCDLDCDVCFPRDEWQHRLMAMVATVDGW